MRLLFQMTIRFDNRLQEYRSKDQTQGGQGNQSNTKISNIVKKQHTSSNSSQVTATFEGLKEGSVSG